MNPVMNWLSMGGYSIYIWPAYLLVSAVLLFNVLAVNRGAAQTKKKLLQWYKSNTA